MSIDVRWLIRVDMPQILDIESESFETCWSEDEFIRCLRQRNCIGIVAEENDCVLGYLVYELHKDRFHVLNFAVAKAARRRGVGTAMLKRLIGKMAPTGRRRIMLEVRESNLDAQCFFRAIGFKAVSVLRDFYDDTDEDAYVMQCRVNQEATTR